jgi:hypothetical protein
MLKPVSVMNRLVMPFKLNNTLGAPVAVLTYAENLPTGFNRKRLRKLHSGLPPLTSFLKAYYQLSWLGFSVVWAVFI